MTDPIVAAARFIGSQLEWTRHATDEQGGPYAEGVLAEIADCAAKIRYVVDGPSAKKYLGPCGAPTVMGCEHCEAEVQVGDAYATVPGSGGLVQCAEHASNLGELRVRMSANCEGDVYGPAGGSKGTCRTCGAQVAQDERRAWLDEQVRDKAFRAAHIAEAYGINVKTIRSWAERGHLREHSRDRRGWSLYLVGDVLDLAAQAAARRAENEAKRDRLAGRLESEDAA